jgi:putative glutamine amidotransferase
VNPPVIGITRCHRVDDYVASVERAGGRTRILEIHESPRDLLGRLDGLLLTGGGDVDPAFYGDERHQATADAEPGRDEFEIDLARRAVDAGLPVFAICRGAQVLNVSRGGTLIQDVPSQVTGADRHAVPRPRDAPAHVITVSPASLLYRVLGPAVDATSHCVVNSRHHQAVSRLGAGLVASATANDGVVEAIERPEGAFCLGVQWHPENFLTTGRFAPLFAAFVAAAAARLAGRLPPPDTVGEEP